MWCSGDAVSSAGLKAKNVVGSYTTIILTVIITLVVLVMATLLVLPNIAGTTPTATSTTTSTSPPTTTSTTTTTSPPTEFIGPTLTNETSGLKLEVTLSSTSVNPNGYLGVRFNLTGAQEVNASYVELDVFNSQNQQVKGLAYRLGHTTQTPQPGPQGQMGTLYWQASTDSYFKVDVTPGTYTLIIGVTYENLTIKTSINVLGGTTSTVSTSPSSSSTTNRSLSDYVCVRVISDYDGIPIEGVEFHCSPATVQNGTTTVTTILLDVKTNSSGWVCVHWTHSDVMTLETEYQGKAYNFSIPMFLGDNYALFSVPSGNVTKTTRTTTVTGWEDAVRLIISESENVEVKQYTMKKGITFNRGDAAFSQILHLLNNTKVVRETLKTKIVNNNTVSVTIPYVYDWFLTFRLRDSTLIKLDLVQLSESEATIWFETETTIYEVSVSHDLMPEWNAIIASVTSTNTKTSVPTTTCIIEIDPIPIPNLRSLKGNSSEVVVGTVVEKTDLKFSNGDLSTVFKVYVNQTVKGDFKEGSIILVGQTGTELCPARQDPLMEAGDQVVLFLAEYPNSTIRSIFAAQQGRFIIQDSKVSSLNFIYPDSWTFIQVHDIQLDTFLDMIKGA